SFERGVRSMDEITSPVRTIDWDLDLVGNWTQIGFGGGPFGRTHNRSNEITDVFTGFSDYDPTYDENGNTTYIALPTSEERTFTYDAWNRLREVKVSGVAILSYVYDALGRRIRETADSGEEYYYGAGWQVLSERDGATSSDDTLREYVWGLQYIDEILARDEDKTGDGDTRDVGDETIYYVQDANWNVITLLDESGAAVERVLYDPYGLPSFLEGDWDAISSSAYGNRVLFTGRLWNPTSLTYDYRNREYSPYLGRFLQRDPIGIWGDEANAGNGYSYPADPVALLDPFGLQRESPGGRIVPGTRTHQQNCAGASCSRASWISWPSLGIPCGT